MTFLTFIIPEKQGTNCPTNEANYRSIEEVCYYFATDLLNYEKSQENCATKFPGGRLFETSLKKH